MKRCFKALAAQIAQRSHHKKAAPSKRPVPSKAKIVAEKAKIENANGERALLILLVHILGLGRIDK